MFAELDVVVVTSLLVPHRRVDGTQGCIRQPCLGDQGTIVHVLGPRDFIVECVDPDGYTVWLADFKIDELSVPPRESPSPNRRNLPQDSHDGGVEMLVKWPCLAVLALVACNSGVTALPHHAAEARQPASSPTRGAVAPAAVPKLVVPLSQSAAAPLDASQPTMPPANAIRYEVVEPSDDDPDGEKAGVFAKRGGATFTISAPWANIRGVSVLVESDLDGDGLIDALIESASLSSYVPTTYFFVAGTMSDRFVPQEIDTGVSLEVESWRGRPSVVIHSDNEGYNVDRPQSVTRRFAFERGRAVKVGEQRAVEVKALANLRAEDFDGAAPNEERRLLFDLDGDGKKDAIVGTLWQRWGRIMWQVRFADGRVSEGGNSGCKRLGVLAEKTMGHRDLVCDFDARLTWNGQNFGYRAVK